MNLAPVLDVNSNSENPVIGVRSYGDDVQLVSELGTWYVRGIQEMGVVAVAKHFPGHGETAQDSHHALPAVPHTFEQIQAIDLPPFEAAMNRGNLDAVMTAHVRYPGIDGENAPPATMSRGLLTGLLRTQLHFEGLVITDDLEMSAIYDTFGVGPAAVRAISSGADLIMVIWRRSSKDEAFEYLLKAARSGELPPGRLDEAVRRILTIKSRRGILSAPPPDPDRVATIVGHPHHVRIAEEIARRSVTELDDPNDIVPLHLAPTAGLMVIGPRGPFTEAIKARHPTTYVIPVGKRPKPAQRAAIIVAARKYSKRVEAYVVVVKKKELASLAKELAARVDKPVIAVALGSPYFLDAGQVDAYLCSYSHRDISAVATARVLLGLATARGINPVVLRDRNVTGAGAGQVPAGTQKKAQ